VFFELLSHFKIHLLILSLILILPAYYSGHHIITFCVLASLLLNTHSVLPWYFGRTQPLTQTELANYSKVKVLTSNVKFNNREFAPLLDLIEKENPDVVLLQELNEEWRTAIKPLEKRYPYSFIEDPGNNFGIAILSKTLLTKKEVINIQTFDTPSLSAVANIDGLNIQFISTHPNPPISKELFLSRDEMFNELTYSVQRSSHPIVIGGDFNVTMWSPSYKKLIKNSGLKNARKGFGMQGTWPIGESNYTNFMNIQKGEKKGTDLIPRWVVEKHPIKLPIDHVLVSKELVVHNAKVGKYIKSDHLPLIVELLIPKS